ncbi:LysR family transcriptional regulator [Pseudomonas segetis]|uniref:DNA-binding transcriptional regulator, LysR family n=1 Tax=Pseudomonas segetis TaxID=298908 RepID=A0A238ZGG6_9PSED|nr:LysR family transcriptional regulator [Pseudomonas segetis]SNR82606.1 DNA-binding transcriptional regulator, LysR family [Pseudomonas segetis]
MRINQRALAYLNEVIHHRSLRRAAQHLNIDPSAISRQIAALEQELDTRLLERTAQGVSPTEAGEMLVAHYRQQQANDRGVLSRLSDLRGLRQGHVRIAVGEGFIADLISQPLQSFILSHPGIDLEVNMAGANEAIGLVKEDAVDFALVYAPAEDDSLHVHVDTLQPLDLITPPDHPLAQSTSPISMAALRNESLALIHNSTGMGQLAVIVAQLEHLQLRPKLRTNSVAVLVNFVKSGIGVAFMPELTVSDELQSGSIRRCTLANRALRDARARIVSHKGRELTVASQACLEHLRDGMRFFNDHAPSIRDRK